MMLLRYCSFAGALIRLNEILLKTLMFFSNFFCLTDYLEIREDSVLTYERWEIIVTGTVQGVGFRPFIYRLAERFALIGWVLNGPQGVRIQVQGSNESLQRFVTAIQNEAPSHALIASIFHHLVPTEPEAVGFIIIPSDTLGETAAVVPADLASCPDCLADVSRSDDRRYRYSFANCTHCGPRFTIVTSLPYDRSATSMAGFPMCPSCNAEYHDPSDRRFHAQPIACPECGPTLQLLKFDDASHKLVSICSKDMLSDARQALQDGRVIALKGLGGFHLSCDAANADAVTKIRGIKGRGDKPFAVMCRSLEQVRSICLTSPEDEIALMSDRRPIVIMPRKSLNTADICGEVAPGQDTLGVMLPYTPLHHLLIESLPHPLVMTSANLSDEPIARDESELDPAIIAGVDLVATHNRPIVSRCDDSVLIASPYPIFIRRSRGYVPSPVPVPLTVQALGIGADLKNTACFIRDGLAYPTQHIGDVEDISSLEALKSAVDHFRSVFGFQPKAVGCDLHPGYTSRRAALTMGLPVIEVQHHHAHIASCMAENAYMDPVIGVSFDGTGYGPDGTIWGGEFMIADFLGYKRAASLKPIPMPGGEKAAREPWRMALAYLLDAFDGTWPGFSQSLPVDSESIDLLLPAVRNGINTPLTSSGGRLFDAVACLIGGIAISTFEGQAAMALETLARRSSNPAAISPVAVLEEDILRLDFRPVFRDLYTLVRDGTDRADLALGFHLAVADGILEVCKRMHELSGLNTVALSGGVFQNRLLLTEVTRRLEAAGLRTLCHRQVPPNDGGISLGHAAVASATLTKE